MNIPVFSTVAALAVAIWVLLSLLRNNSRFRVLGLLALAGHLLFGLVILPRLPYTWDIKQFHEGAITLLQGGSVSASEPVASFAGIQAVLYAVFGVTPSVIIVFNSLCAVLVAVPAADLVGRLYPQLDSWIGLVATVLFLPLPFVFLTIPMRDTLSVLLFVTLLTVVARMLNGNFWLIMPGLPVWGGLSLLRPELAGVIALASGAAVVVRMAEKYIPDRIRARTLISTAILSTVSSLLFVGPLIPINSFERRRTFRTTGGAAYLEGVGYDTWLDLVLAAPVRALYFQYAPFPLHVSSLFDLVVAMMLPVLITLTVAAYRCARQCDSDLAVLVLVIMAYLIGIIGYGLIDSNFGTTIRHRIPFTFLLCVLAAPALERWRRLLTIRISPLLCEGIRE